MGSSVVIELLTVAPTVTFGTPSVDTFGTLRVPFDADGAVTMTASVGIRPMFVDWDPGGVTGDLVLAAGPAFGTVTAIAQDDVANESTTSADFLVPGSPGPVAGVVGHIDRVLAGRISRIAAGSKAPTRPGTITTTGLGG